MFREGEMASREGVSGLASNGTVKFGGSTGRLTKGDVPDAGGCTGGREGAFF